jgi:hypothetical protein
MDCRALDRHSHCYIALRSKGGWLVVRRSVSNRYWPFPFI